MGEIIKSVCVSISLLSKTSWTLYSSQSSTDVHQACHHSRVPGDVVTYCFDGKPKYFYPPNQK